MDFGSFVRGFFGLRQLKPDNFDDGCAKCQDRQWPEGSSEERSNSSVDVFFHDGDRHFFNIMQPVDPFSIFQQMEDAFSNFFSFHSSRMLDFPSQEDPSNGHESHRDFILNPSERNFSGFFWDEHGHKGSSGFSSIESFLQPESPREHVLKPFYRDSQNSVEPTLQQDSDLDGAVLNDRSGHDLLKELPQQPKIGTNWSFRKSVSIRTVRGADGTVEEHRTVRDSSGNEVTTVRKSIGDQSYVVTLHKDNEGLREKKEDLVNLDEKDIPQFEEKWNNIKDNTLRAPKRDLVQEPGSLTQDAPGDPHYSSIFEKLFGL